ncbi:hypothetical protein CCAX7_53410 [Capsulimonas corticalis]|uniref:DUF58 domain-containing protein n=1 Tax=Capsulimonas corticalis TaxID=2219043 RepID=A0A402CNN8_9BACT|nr:DUF58 domain-containing protein [Capsulimonas corticalis]BDI33290.1 hypothetical protein CCAX7_53410 [Capsulimonas corticalis]
MSTSNSTLKKLALAVGGGFTAIVAILFRSEQMYLMAAIMLLIPAVILLVGRLLVNGITCARELPFECAEGDRVTVVLRIGDIGRLPKFFLRAADKLPADLKLVGSDAPLILQLDPGEQRVLSYNLELTKRGAYQIGPTLVSTTDPFGFTTFRKLVGDVQELLVLPTPLPTSRLFLDGGVVGLRGEEGGSQRGGGMDFHGVREYRQGDDLRRVHWRTTARTGELAVTEYTQGASLEVLVALDLSRRAYDETGTGLQSALEYGVKLAVTVADNLARHGHRALLLTPDTINMPYPPSNHPLEMPALLEALARAEAVHDLSLADMLERFRPQAPAGITLVTITPVVDGALVQAIRHYGAQGVRAFGFYLDGASFHPASHLRVTPDAGVVHVPGTVWRTVGRGDDLAASVEGLAYGYQ